MSLDEWEAYAARLDEIYRIAVAELGAEQVDAALVRLVADAPPFTPEFGARIAALVAP